MGTLIFIGIACTLLILAAYFTGKSDVDTALAKENDTLKRVQRNLNALVLDQKHQIDAVHGLWATDLDRLIKHHRERELFFRIGYPEDRL